RHDRRPSDLRRSSGTALAEARDELAPCGVVILREPRRPKDLARASNRWTKAKQLDSSARCFGVPQHDVRLVQAYVRTVALNSLAAASTIFFPAPSTSSPVSVFSADRNTSFTVTLFCPFSSGLPR